MYYAKCEQKCRGVYQGCVVKTGESTEMQYDCALQTEAETATKVEADPQQEAAPSRTEAPGRRTKQTAARSSKRMTRAQVRPCVSSLMLFLAVDCRSSLA